MPPSIDSHHPDSDLAHTLLLITTANAINATLYDKLNYDFIRDVAPIARIIIEPFVMVVHPSLPAKTIPEFIAYAKANPDMIAMASSGIGTFSHVAGELFKLLTAIEMVYVPYRGAGPALTDLLGGQVQVFFASVSGSIEHIRSGKLRALALSGATRLPVLPDIPSIAEFVPGYEGGEGVWYGVGAPRNTPTEIIEKLNKEITALLAEPSVKMQLTDLGSAALPGSPHDFGEFIAKETEKWAKVIRAAKIKPE
jgi:tripartite-type tricarboxylate transporter receptor subunit TctC